MVDFTICPALTEPFPGGQVNNPDPSELVVAALNRSGRVKPGQKTIVTVGSVGQPRDNDPRALELKIVVFAG